jgi:hypothetical protein
MTEKSNIAKGVNSYDSTSANTLIHFFNRNVTPYPTEAGAPKFEMIPVEKQKDIMVNVARMHGQQEYNRIMDLVQVLQSQAEELKRRLDITDMVHAAKYEFQTYHGNIYWLVYDHRKQFTRLTITGPNDWSSSAPDEYEYICAVKWMGDYTWVEVKQQDDEEPI